MSSLDGRRFRAAAEVAGGPGAAAHPGHADLGDVGGVERALGPEGERRHRCDLLDRRPPPSGRGTLQIRDKFGGGRSETSSQGALTTLPQTWTTGHTWPDGPLSATGGP